MTSGMVRFGLVALLVTCLSSCTVVSEKNQRVPDQNSADKQTPPPTRQQLALAAGYKAQFVCSAMFNGGKTLAQIESDELTGIYPSYEPLMDVVGEAEIVREHGASVFVKYAEDLPPRISKKYRRHGCISAPQGGINYRIISPKLLTRQIILAVGNNYRLDENPKTPVENVLWPNGDKLPGIPFPQEVKTPLLEKVLQAAFDNNYNGKTSAIIVLQNNNLLGEQYKDGYTIHTSQRTWSVAKSIAVSIIGAAVHQGHLEVNEKNGLPSYSPNDPRARISIDSFLRMASGLDTYGPGNRTDDIYFGGGTVQQHATRAPINHPQGTVYNYANNDTMLAMRALRMRIPDQHLIFPYQNLLDKIGMRNTNLETDWNGDFILSSQVWTTARDLARLGQLYLNDGMWNGERILAEGWVEYVTTPSGPQPYGETKPEGCHRGYGAQFWLYHNCPGVPEDTSAALGNRGQFVVIIPSRNVVIVRRGYDTRENRFNMVKFIPDILAALPE